MRDELGYLVEARTIHTRLFSAEATRRQFGPSRYIGRFQVSRFIGEGGMSDVYEAHDPAFDRRVAIKLLKGPDGNDGSKEAQALAKVEHANVVRILEIGTHEDRTFIVMEYLDGQPLSRWMEQRHEWRSTLAMFIDAGRGLVAIHEQNLVHRDFKPGNVMVTEHGRVSVVDLGLAHDLGSGPPSDPGFAGLGTLLYMPLEQLLGREVGPASDQFSFCSSLYEALWNAQPFPGDARQTRIDVLQRSDASTPSFVADGPPRTLWSIIRRGLARDPHQRWPSMAALMQELERLDR